MGTYVSIAGLVDICCQCLVWIGVIGSLLHFYCKIKRNRVKNPNWPEANQLAIYKHGQGFELRTTMNKSS